MRSRPQREGRLDSRGINVDEDRVMMSAFIDALFWEFIKRKHESVTLDAIGQRTAALLRQAPPPSGKTSALIQQLTVSQASVFRYEERRLMLTESAISQPQAVEDALLRFIEDLRLREPSAGRAGPETTTERPAGPPEPPPGSGRPADSERPPGRQRSSERPPESTEPAPASERSKALEDFFEGFEQEILKARLGNEGSQERG